MTETQPVQLEFNFSLQEAFVNDEFNVDIHCLYKAQKPARGGFGLHITRSVDFKGTVNDILHIYSTHRDVLTSGGQIVQIYTTPVYKIPIGDFQWWNYEPDQDVWPTQSKSYNALTKLLGVSDTDLVTCILYKSI